ncbi:MAG: YlmH/Sll1252 family protein [Bariatricus sp.]|nr:YlmH/Sll1252 family protein [Bariatricus sp.]
MEKEEVLLRKRFIELSNQAYQRGIVMYTDFLNLNELNILHTTPKDSLAVPFRTFGGYAFAERQMAAFLPDAFYLYMEENEILDSYPMSVIRIEPLNGKFAEDLSHRDYLGALLNLGIDRLKLGDILIEAKQAFLFASENLSDFICSELTRVRHTTVRAVKVAREEFTYEPRYEEIRGTVASVRLDSLLSLAWNTSRSKMTPFVEGARVYVNGKLITSNGYHVREDDIISVRGMGRFQYKGMISETKKGRCLVLVYKYI